MNEKEIIKYRVETKKYPNAKSRYEIRYETISYFQAMEKVARIKEFEASKTIRFTKRIYTLTKTEFLK